MRGPLIQLRFAQGKAQLRSADLHDRRLRVFCLGSPPTHLKLDPD